MNCLNRQLYFERDKKIAKRERHFNEQEREVILRECIGNFDETNEIASILDTFTFSMLNNLVTALECITKGKLGRNDND